MDLKPKGTGKRYLGKDYTPMKFSWLIILPGIPI